MEVQSNNPSPKSSLIVTVVIAGIVLFIIMGAVGPHSWLMKKWDESGGQTQDLPAASGPSIVGGPSLSAAQIDTILRDAGSPAAGSGNAFVLGSAQYNINDAYALAFFKHESGFGLNGAAAQTRSIGNIICTPGYSCIGRFRSYPSWSASIDDWYKLISGPAYVAGGLTTLSQILPKYAPASDNNDPASYIAAVQADVDAWRIPA